MVGIWFVVLLQPSNISFMRLRNDLLLRTIAGEEVERPPVWLMRQAGRILPQYRAIRESLSGFKELVETPDLAAEVTIQPVDELDVDAAIIFSDILVIPEAMGLTYNLIEKVGPRFPKTITSQVDINRLGSGEQVLPNLQYVFDAVKLTKERLNGRVPLIGFAGAPWTLLAYMVEGGGSKTFSKAKRFLYQNPEDSHLLLQKLTDSIVYYLNEKVRSGVDVVQIFDSWAGLLGPDTFREFSLPYIKQICERVNGVPITIFAKDAWYALGDLSETSCDTIGLDWTISPSFAREQSHGNQIFQGNLDPCVLYTSEENVEVSALKMIKDFGKPFIANLGHGVYPDTPLSSVKHFVKIVKEYRY